MEAGRQFHKEYLLGAIRDQVTQGVVEQREPAEHQSDALSALLDWHKAGGSGGTGAILVLPTGAGKTFTAVRYLYTGPVPEGAKVLWLAHTHHLLEQAFQAFEGDVVSLALNPGTREVLRARVVSGADGHYPIHTVQPSDDVVISTLQTVSRADVTDHASLRRWLASASGGLCVVFDEAHHAPAPQYRRLLVRLRAEVPAMRLLGLTATPVYSDPKREGRLWELFPQRVIQPVTAETLFASGILAKPVIEEVATCHVPEVSQRDYELLLMPGGDVPEQIVESLARSASRNALIAATYDESRHGKTLIFADRWWQCEAIAHELRERHAGLQVRTVYSHTEPRGATAEERNARTRDENTAAIDAFRRGEAQVLVNVRMLTEGTDVPDAESVFLTRQTTSQVLLTQMVGRALRGPRFGGTKQARIVSFIDDWRHLVNWAHFDTGIGAAVGPDPDDGGNRPPVQLISVELVRRLAEQMARGVNVAPVPFLQMLPAGWYRTEYSAICQLDAGEQDGRVEPAVRLVMVFEGEREGFAALVADAVARGETLLMGSDGPDREVEDLMVTHFPSPDEHFGSDLRGCVESIARHVAQHGDAPPFFEFEARREHDMDLIVREMRSRALAPDALDDALELEYSRSDRYWRSLYHSYDLFRTQYDACYRRQRRMERGALSQEQTVAQRTLAPPPPREPDQATKDSVVRDDGHCLACGSERRLQADHVMPKRQGGGHERHNLQTLCAACNRLKGDEFINFRASTCSSPATHLRLTALPRDRALLKQLPTWERFLRGTVNFLYRCSAVDRILVGARGPKLDEWTIVLKEGNALGVVEPHMEAILTHIQDVRVQNGLAYPVALSAADWDGTVIGVCADWGRTDRLERYVGGSEEDTEDD